jgi:hypothetical protein
MCQSAKLFGAALTALLILAAVGRAAVAGPFEDANAGLAFINRAYR